MVSSKKTSAKYEIIISEKSALKRRSLIETFVKNGYSKKPSTGLICDGNKRELHLLRKNIKLILQWEI